MHKYLLKRLLSLIPVLFVVSLAIFLLIHLVPGDPAAAILGEEASPEQIAALRETLGFNDPLPVQYFRWVAGLFRGDWGTSFFMEGTMLEIIGAHMIPTLQQTLVAVGFATLIGVPLGMLAAIRHGSPLDRIISAFSSVGISLPSFLMGLCLVLLISVKLRWLPSSGYKSIADFGWQTHIRYMLLPGIALGFIEMGLIIRMTRSSMLEILSADYMRMAKAKGVSRRRMFFRHALMNALIGILTVVGLSFISCLGGATVTETIFNIPGLGKLTLNAVMRRDYEVVQAVVLLVSLMNVLCTLILDLLYALIDPRVRLN
ncbi:MAG: ABC transporter permease [Oscillospiraceae bacterium]|nr:ABC transporter permease [Oscillospiraceae bacterium]